MLAAAQDHRYADLREGVRAACAPFDSAYWQRIDRERGFPEEFFGALTLAGWLAVMVPKRYGGSGLGLSEASIIVEEINRSGGNAGFCHGQIHAMGTLARNGSEAQKDAWLPRVATGELRLQSLAVTEPDAGTDTTGISTTAVLHKSGAGSYYTINGTKTWISRVRHTEGMLLLARTTPLEQCQRKTEGLSMFMVNVHEAIGQGMSVKPIPNMVNHEVSELQFEGLELPANMLVGKEGQGFAYLLEGMHAERALFSAEAVGDAYWFIDRATAYANQRVVFNRPIGQNQGVQFPLAQAWIEAEAANLMRFRACELYDAGRPCADEANMAKYLAAKAAWEAADACLQTYGGFGFACEYDVERKFRETRLHQITPVSTNMVLAYMAQHVLGMPRAY
ncbi:acyl-CoA dehydrogenase family protein [uncultured Ramlibacter sp.]|uniref:acyl-CoA dehydrogenase family protein n=1 Tax=uncultured Ramlibacter sp. TaxID=260755 RepID=UPI002620BB6D|nr:acyl-CoA dehydrogenase family protein [uncultured Ramlibacter sp.]